MVNVKKLLKYFTIFCWSLAVFTAILYIIAIKTHTNFPLFNFIDDELTFIFTPLIFKWLYLIWKKYINNGQ